MAEDEKVPEDLRTGFMDILYTYRYVFLVLLFGLLVIVPFIPAFFEVARKGASRSSRLSTINMELSRDPAYFGESFAGIVTNALFKLFNVERMERFKTGSFDVQLSSPGKERIRVVRSQDLRDLPAECDTVVFCHGDLAMAGGRTFYKELVVNGAFSTDADVLARALFVMGPARLGGSLTMARWLHVTGDLSVEAPSDLGINTYCGGMMSVTSHLAFRRLFAREIRVGAGRALVDEMVGPEMTDLEIADRPGPGAGGGERAGKRVVVIQGSLKIYDKMLMRHTDEYVIIEGNVVCDKDIEIEGNVWIKGDVFSQGAVSLKDGVVVGTAGKTKSVVAKKDIRLGGNVKIHGYVLTEKEGTCL